MKEFLEKIGLVDYLGTLLDEILHFVLPLISMQPALVYKTHYPVSISNRTKRGLRNEFFYRMEK